MAELEVQIDGRGAERGANVVTRSLDKIQRRARGTSQAVDRTGRSFERAGRAGSAFGRVLGVVATGLAVRQVVRYADAYTNLQNRLRLVTDSSEELVAVQDEVFRIAQDTRGSLEGVGELYARIARSSEQLGLSQRRVLDVTESVSQAIIVSGVSAEAANAAIVQFGQGLAAGALRGDELRSVLEQTPRLARAIADGLDVPIGALRELGAEGELTAEKVITALESQADVLAEEFGQTQTTISQGFDILTNSAIRFIGRFGEATGLFSSVGEGLGNLGRAIDGISDSFFDATFAAAQFVRATAGGFATLDERFRVFQNSLVGVIATLAGDEAVADAAAQDRLALERELEAQQNVIVDALEEERRLFEERRAARQLDEGLRESLLNEVPTGGGAGVIDPAAAKEAERLRKELEKLGETVRSRVLTPFEEYQEEVAQLGTLLEGQFITQQTYNRAIAQAAATYTETVPSFTAYNDQLERAAEITAAVITPQEEYRDSLLELNSLLNAGLITQQTYNRAVQEAQDTLVNAVQANDGLATFLENTATQAARNIQSSFANFLFDPFDDGLEGLLSNFADTLKRMAAEALSAQVFQILGNSLGASGGGGVGGFFASLLGGSFADGGDFSAGRPILVGEEGPELITPKAPGSVIPNDQLARMGSSDAAAPQVDVPVNIVNVMDPQAATAAIESNQGQQAIINVIQNNPDAIRRALN